ncbi:hypothetical protein BV20DRAFT_728367 [Pilatotrama ljubarskyi]|nr:hypothetical protein BV20DRAFT_728367 [Pilatotrama ljubarskyi]
MGVRVAPDADTSWLAVDESYLLVRFSGTASELRHPERSSPPFFPQEDSGKAGRACRVTLVSPTIPPSSLTLALFFHRVTLPHWRARTQTNLHGESITNSARARWRRCGRGRTFRHTPSSQRGVELWGTCWRCAVLVTGSTVVPALNRSASSIAASVSWWTKIVHVGCGAWMPPSIKGKQRPRPP